MHPRIAQDRLGHASYETTARVYQHIVAGDQVPAAEAVERLLVNDDVAKT